ncbi:MAG: ETC complex I subunit [Alphaproteobacteria bacterium]|nr:ETC complex I subunit [Alphaproteobacteria bacterium]
MNKVRISQPTRTAMQSGLARTRNWLVEFEPAAPRETEPLMGWTSSRDTRAQVKLRFPTKEAAIHYAEKHGHAYRVIEPKTRRPRPKSYAANFK